MSKAEKIPLDLRQQELPIEVWVNQLLAGQTLVCRSYTISIARAKVLLDIRWGARQDRACLFLLSFIYPKKKDVIVHGTTNFCQPRPSDLTERDWLAQVLPYLFNDPMIFLKKSWYLSVLRTSCAYVPLYKRKDGP